ncbi:MAG: hypothetical protein A3K06_02175 [Candidatus Doudnabacteria bacterium RIFCSPHIGHO2_01_52_17]|uniref:Undecaprenyl pyrophosphate phosphatase n=1 Tax=Candidatus Doudnabacteria bacterium RIFCSPHIGHO2_01_52_17 TaxID=1817820 RepID=A0A1F5NAS9_9BACT|nr:MAG: hypothetical protein A3K06_02175 [Candidatus Doudnabacteria bacterium RIFCSPHIGHO2_01_52_17]
MERLILVSILVTIVYSWDDFQRILRILFYAILRKQRPAQILAANSDRLVSIILVFATLPIGLSYLLAGHGPFLPKLLLVGFGFLVISFVAFLASSVAKYYRVAFALDGTLKLASFGFTLGSLVAPVLASLAEPSILPRRLFAKLAVFLSLPPLIVVLLKVLNYHYAPEELLPNIDVLLQVLLVALFARIAIEFLSHYLRILRFHSFSGYFRVVLGVVLSSILLLG